MKRLMKASLAGFAISLFACPSREPTTTSNATSAVNASNATAPSTERLRRAERIRSYFAERAKRPQSPVVATTRTESGQIIDWIRPESQLPPGAKLAVAPERTRAVPPPRYTRISTFAEVPGVERLAQTELQLQPGARGPKGTVPVVRFDVETYLKNERQLPENPADVLKKTPPPSPDPTNSRYYGVWQRFDTFFGTGGRINIWDVTGPNSGETSIAQTAILRGNPMQGIEAGKIELNSLNGDDRPHFFTFYRTNGGATGDWVGGYNTLVKGWIQVSSSVAPGMSLSSWDSAIGGNQYSLDIEVRLWQGNWWVWAAGEWAGYYPVCNGGKGTTPCPGATLFSEAGIRDKADRIDWYGEVFDTSAPNATTTDMGSGRFASEGWSKAAYFRNLTFYWQPNTNWWWDSGSPSATDTNCYTVSGPFYSQDNNWHNWFYYGGPGKDARGCR